MSGVIVSQDLQFANKKIQSSPAPCVCVNVQPHDGPVKNTFTAQATSKFAIPTGQMGSWMSTQNHPYLVINLAMKSRATACAGIPTYSGAHDLIKEIRVFYGAQKIYKVLEYLRTVHMLKDVQYSSEHSDVEQWIDIGSRKAKAFLAGVANGWSYYKCVVPLVDLFFPSTMKAIPLQDLGNDNLCLQVVWNSYGTWKDTETTTPTDVQITNMRFLYKQLQFSPEVANAIRSETQGVYQINTLGIFSNKLPLQEAQSANTLIPVSVSQLKSLLYGYYATGKLRDRIQPFAINADKTAFGDFYVSHGGLSYPQQVVAVSNTGFETKMEVIKAVKPLGFTDNNLLAEFLYADLETLDKTNKSFMIGLDLEQYASVNEKQLLQGINTYSVDCLFNQRFGTTLPASTKLYCLAIYEKVLNVSNKQASIAY